MISRHVLTLFRITSVVYFLRTFISSKQKTMDTLTANKPTAKPTEDFLPLNGTDHVEFYVGNAKQSAYYYQSARGYELVAYAGPETGVRDRASYVLQQGKIRLVLTSAMHPGCEISN